jgi:hypothetical protein
VWFPSHLPLEGTNHIKGFLGHNRRPMVHRVNYIDSIPEISIDRVARADHSMVGGIGTHMVLWALSQDSAVRLRG